MSGLLFGAFFVGFADTTFFLTFVLFAFFFFIVLMHVTLETFFAVGVGCTSVSSLAERAASSEGEERSRGKDS